MAMAGRRAKAGRSEAELEYMVMAPPSCLEVKIDKSRARVASPLSAQC